MLYLSLALADHYYVVMLGNCLTYWCSADEVADAGYSFLSVSDREARRLRESYVQTYVITLVMLMIIPRNYQLFGPFIVLTKPVWNSAQEM